MFSTKHNSKGVLALDTFFSGLDTIDFLIPSKNSDETYLSLPPFVHRVYAAYSTENLDTKITLTNADYLKTNEFSSK